MAENLYREIDVAQLEGTNNALYFELHFSQGRIFLERRMKFSSRELEAFRAQRILRGNGYSDQCLSSKQYYVLVLFVISPDRKSVV